MTPSRAPLTHFLCIPLITTTSRAQLARSLADFRADVTSPNSFALPDDAVRPVGTLHLTLGVMSFPKNEGLERAIALLKGLRPAELLASVRPGTTPMPPQEPLKITLKGLHCTQSPEKTSVLYAPPSDSQGILQSFCEKVRAVFVKEGLVQEADRPLLLHATIINTVYVKGANARGSQPQRGKRSRLTIDARDIVDRYEDYVWIQDMAIEKIAICKMSAQPVEGGEEGDQAYVVEAEVDM
jgi:activating signal cointegrator complex subunit 1